jgi:hypothetical protein
VAAAAIASRCLRHGVAHYRIYFLDRNDHIRHALSVECDGDAEAVELAQSHGDGRCLELWQGARRVARIEADDGQGKPS